MVAQRFGHRRDDGVPLALVAALGIAALAPDAGAALALYRELVDRRYAGLPAALVAAAYRVRSLAATRASPAERGELAALDVRFAAALTDAGRAAALGGDAVDLARAAAIAPRGRPATGDPARTLVVRRADDGAVGIVVDAGGLAAAAAQPDALAQIAPQACPLVLPTGAPPPPGVRVLATVPLGAVLPHLTLAIVNDPTDPDPLDDVIASRSRRHVGLTVGLAVVLALGLLATIRGAARERELARLKSDFVSTVSHELKTPLTSIRMFAEMLEQGVAQGDPAKMARYHGVIVQESQRLGLLIANLLDYAQIEKGTRRYQLARTPVAAVARDAVATFETLREAQAGNDVVVVVSPDARLRHRAGRPRRRCSRPCSTCSPTPPSTAAPTRRSAWRSTRSRTRRGSPCAIAARASPPASTSASSASSTGPRRRTPRASRAPAWAWRWSRTT